MSPFSPKRGIFGTAHAWIFRISWETQKKFTNIVAGALRVSSSSFAKFLSSVFLTLTTLVFVSPAFLISQSSLLFIVTQSHGNKYGRMRGKLQPFTNFWYLLQLWLLCAPTPKLAAAGLHGRPRQGGLLWKWFFRMTILIVQCTLHRGPRGRIFAHIIR